MYIRIKRWLDVLFSLICGVLLSPLFAALALAVKLDSRGPVFFRQKRVGRNKVTFDIYKFRTMFNDTPHDTPTHLLVDPERWITRTGRFLRKTSLDELPQLINILKGDMSFVGPRPALWNQDDLVSARDRYTGRYGLTPNMLRPGLTGWAQINGRDELPIRKKAALDGAYAERFGFFMDCRCLLGTIGSVLFSDGVHEGASNGSQRTHIALVTAYFAPEISPITHLYADLAADLVSYGARVSVVTNLPNRGLDEQTRRAYLERTDELSPAGYRILRVGARTREGKGLLVRGLHFVFNALALYQAAKKLRADAYLLGSMPPFLGLVGARLAARARTVYVLQDIFPDSLVAMGKYDEGHPVVRMCRAMERRSYRFNSRFVTLSEDMKRTLLLRGVDEGRVRVIPNWADTDAIRAVPREDNPLFDELGLSREGFYAVYAGTLGVLQQPDVLLDAAKLLVGEENVCLVIFGGGALYAHVAARIRGEGLGNVRLHKLEPASRVNEVYSLGNVSLIPLQAGAARFATPSKTWTAMAAGQPLIVSAEAGTEWAQRIADAACGIIVEPGDPAALAHAVRQICRDASLELRMRQNARAYAETYATRERSTRAYYETLTDEAFGSDTREE